ncbi:DUF6625 family protein [Liquorilactobacillus hordei]|uniref:DUF6625 family protein n=1 Tax=Liquorilactobacillus hordei TaxID=468911 RepID=UPI0039ECAE75
MEKIAKVVLIVVYFGKLPNYFSVWLKSASANSDYDFIIFTDIEDTFEHGPNIKFEKITFQEIKEKIQIIMDFQIVLDNPYKLCDYKPVYGEIFKEYIKKYDFWGFCDVDLIFGNLSHFIQKDMLKRVDKLYDLGHFTLLKNSNKCNSLWKYRHTLNAGRFDEVFKTSYVCHFDEEYGLTRISNSIGIRSYKQTDFADINYKKFNFEMIGKKNRGKKQIFYWSNGNLFCLTLLDEGIIKSEEVMYIHLQKRKMICNYNGLINDQFIIEPNRFIFGNTDEINNILKKQKIKRIYFTYFYRRFFELKTNIFQGAIKQKIYRTFFRKISRKIKDRKE